MNTPPRPSQTTADEIVVLGAGYAGIMAANGLAGRLGDGVSVTLLDPRGVFVDRIRLHEFAAGSAEQDVVVPLARLLSPKVRVRLGTAARIRAEEHMVELSDGEPAIRYERLVYAVGSGETVDSVPGATEFAVHPAGINGARALRAAVAVAPPEAPVLIVGGGPTAVEVAAELASRHPLRVIMAVGGDLLQTVSPAGQDATRQRLRRLGVRVSEQCPIASIDAAGAVTMDGHRIDAHIVVWCGSFAVPSLARTSGLEVDARGRLVVDGSLRSVSHPDILGAGDACVLPEQPHLRMACATAMPQGAHAAQVIVDSLAGRPPADFSLGYLGLNVSLGRRDGLIQLVHRDDSPRGLPLTGRLAAVVKEAVYRYARSGLRLDGLRPGTFRWPASGRRTGGPPSKPSTDTLPDRTANLPGEQFPGPPHASLDLPGEHAR